jgi:hypothetical protein
MPKIPMNKTRSFTDPYLIINARDWEWRVLRAYAKDPDKPYARWFCAVTTPYTFGSHDLGDTYIADIISGGGVITFRDDDVPDTALPAGLVARGLPSLEGGLAVLR